MDWHVYEGSKIERLPRLLRPFGLVARNLQTAGTPRGYRGDGITTVHNQGFRKTPEFERAYARAVTAANWDYGIPYRVHQAIWLARQALNVEGDFVELGTGRGFVMSAVLEAIGLTRPLHLFDTFSPCGIVNGVQAGRPNPHYATTFEDVARNFAQWPNVRLHLGDVFETLPNADIESVAFLHVDMNHADPEVFGIRQLWPRMPKGAVLLMDDYAHAGFENQRGPLDEIAAEFGFHVLSTPTGQGIVIK
jgi:O-methyltransferase